MAKIWEAQWWRDTGNSAARDLRNAGAYIEDIYTDPTKIATNAAMGALLPALWEMGGVALDRYQAANTKKVKPPVLPNVPDPNDLAIEKAANEERSRQGRASTILTGNRGLLGGRETRVSARQSLLGY